jgi:hypothetical protein
MSFNLFVLFEFGENRIEESDIRRAMTLIQKNNDYAIKDFDKKLNDVVSKNLHDAHGNTSIFFAHLEPEAPYDMILSLHEPWCEHLDKKFKNFVLEVSAPLYFFKTRESEEDIYNHRERAQKFLRDIVQVNSLLHPLHVIGDTDYNLEALNYDVDKRIGWLNFFSEQEVKNIGADKFKKLKAFKLEFLDGGGVFLRLTENVLDASKKLKEEVEEVLFENEK